MRLRSLLFAGFLLLPTAPAVNAQSGPVPLLWCDGCTPAQKNTTALAQPPGTTVYVGDVITKTVSAYTVFIDVDDGVRPPRRTKVAQSITVDPTYKAAADAYINFYNASPKGWAKQATVRYDGPGSGDRNVYDVVNDSPARNSLKEWASNEMKVDFGTYLSAILGKAGQVTSQNGPKTEVVVVFWDNSRITLRLNIDISHGEYLVWEVVPNSGQDSNRNTVLSSPSNDPVEFRFSSTSDGSPTNPTDWFRWANQMGLLSYNVPSTGPRGGVWACTSGRGVSHCVYVPQ